MANKTEIFNNLPSIVRRDIAQSLSDVLVLTPSAIETGLCVCNAECVAVHVGSNTSWYLTVKGMGQFYRLCEIAEE